jgi:hypothetical protein
MSAEERRLSYTQARDHFRTVLDDAKAGLMPRIGRERDHGRFVVLDGDLHRQDLAATIKANARVLAEGGGWAVVLPGLPVHGDGATFEEAIGDTIDALREYAADWDDHLRTAPNHAEHRQLVHLVQLSDDDQLREWLLAADDAAFAAR